MRQTLARCDPSEVFHLRREDIVAAPVDRLAALCQFLGLPVMPGYLEDCASIVFTSASRSRDKAGYSTDQRARILARLGEYPGLESYGTDR